MEIIELESFGIKYAELSEKYSKFYFDIRISTEYYQDIDELKKLSHKERRLLIRQKSRDSLKRIIRLYPNNYYELIGTRIIPRGIIGSVTGKQLLELEKSEPESYVTICKAGNIKQIKKEKVKQYYSVQGLFAVKVEGFDYSNSIRFIEERIILLKAIDLKEALKKAEIEFIRYGELEYLNSDFRLTKWEFIEVLDSYETGETELDLEGTEVFSICKNRKLKINDIK
ncbi:MAG: hypothetical protein DRJ05_16275 [Bacteroidetes bacterium]|nr:MAG: hypothetical protein DRJ05_16275 [Bacteroidota bacterium]